MKVFISVLFFLFLTSEFFSQSTNCESLRGENEVYTSEPGGSSRSWCSYPATSYTNCQCEKEREMKRIKVARNEYSQVKKRNEATWKRSSKVHQEGRELVHELTPGLEEVEFLQYKAKAMSKYNTALNILSSIQSEYGYCSRAYPNSTSMCGENLKRPYELSKQSIRNDINQLQQRNPTPKESKITLSTSGSSSEPSSDKEKDKSKKESSKEEEKTESSDDIIFKQNQKIINKANNAKNRGDFRTAQKIMNENPDLFSHEERSEVNNQAVGQSVGELSVLLMDVVPDADQGSFSLMLQSGEYSKAIVAEYTYLYSGLGVGVGYTYGFGLGWMNSEFKSKIPSKEGGSFLFQGCLGFSVGNPEAFTFINGFNIKLHYDYYSDVMIYDKNMRNPFETTQAGYSFFEKDGQSTSGGAFGLGIDIILYKYLKVGVVFSGAPNLKDPDGNEKYQIGSTFQKKKYNSQFETNRRWYIGLVFPI
jgi:hypothetical protein